MQERGCPLTAIPLELWREDTSSDTNPELAVAQRLTELGFEVLKPVGYHLRYDLAYYVPASSGQKAQLVRI
jgi:hypothetical protein